MKEFIEKLIGRLEEEKETSFAKYRESFELYVEEFWRGRMGGFAKAIVIVNQLAEEYKDKTMINEQYCWQTCGATEHCKECNRLCNGNIDYYENYDVLSEEYGKDTNIPTIDAGELLGNSVNNGWIPCSERLPDDFMSMEYLTTVKGRFYSEINYYCVVNHKWYSNERTTKEVNVIAWMPKPTVYQPKGE